jgi:hypothetical protein
VAAIDCLATSGIGSTSRSKKKLCVCPCNKLNILQFIWLIFCKTTIVGLVEVFEYVQFIHVQCSELNIFTYRYEGGCRFL